MLDFRLTLVLCLMERVQLGISLLFSCWVVAKLEDLIRIFMTCFMDKNSKRYR